MPHTAFTVLVILLAVLGLGGSPPAGAVGDPHVEDTAGDANYLNDQGLRALGAPAMDEGPDTRPVSLDGADIVAAWYETTFDTVVDRDEDGAPLRARHIPTGLQVHMQTTGAASPTFGPTLSYALWVNVDQCSLIFRMYVAGPATQPDNPPQRAELRTRKAECLEGPKTYTDDITLKFDGAVATLTYPFTATALGSQLLLGPGRTITADTDGHGLQISSVHGANVGGPVIDFAAPTRPFVIGSDVPPAVDCAADSEHPSCHS